jgi:hypothetical protein
MSTVETVQMRRYELIPKERESFLAWWHSQIVPARAKHGFAIPFAYLVPQTDEFIWGVSHAGDPTKFARAEQTYMDSPERAVAFAGQPDRVRRAQVHLVVSEIES